MEKEISSGTMLGIVLIALAVVIGLGFGIFSIAKGVANEGTVGVQDNLNTVSDSAFDDYNDKIVTGTMVKSAVQNFTGKSVAVLVSTNALDKGVKSYAAHANVTPFTMSYDGSDKVYVNYNALLSADNTGAAATKLNPDGDTGVALDTAGTELKGESGDAVLKDGVLVLSHAFEISSSGKVQFDNSIGGFSRTGNCEYLSSSAKFNANLIRDTSGTTIGILFTQLAK